MTETTLLEHVCQVPARIERVFELLSNPSSLDRLTPRWFRLAPSEPLPAQLEPGVAIRYDFRWRRLPLPWTSRITTWEPPSELVYEQERGPYRRFRHEHYFRETGGGTEVRDRILFRSFLGHWIDRWVVGPDLARILLYREQRILHEVSKAQAESEVSGRASLIPCTRASSSAIERPT